MMKGKSPNRRAIERITSDIGIMLEGQNVEAREEQY